MLQKIVFETFSNFASKIYVPLNIINSKMPTLSGKPLAADVFGGFLLAAGPIPSQWESVSAFFSTDPAPECILLCKKQATAVQVSG
jgi:hypothetical protein